MDPITEELAALCRIARHQPRDERLVVFVTHLPMGRELKLAQGLAALGYRLVLVCTAPPAADTRCFERIHVTNNLAELARICASYAPLSFHVFSSWQYQTALLLLRLRPGPVVLDIYDAFIGTCCPGSGWNGLVPQEQLCLVNADGLCCRSLESQLARRQGCRFGGPRLFLPDGCWDTPPAGGIRKRDDGLHVVYIGNLHLTADPTHPMAVHPWLATELGRQGVHYHIYPSPKNFDDAQVRALFDAHAGLLRANPYYHVHAPVAPERLIEELGQYHFGHVFLSRQIRGIDDGVYNDAKYATCMSNKIFDYIDAELVSLLPPNRLIAFLMRRYRAGFTVEENEIATLGDRLRAIDPTTARNSLRAARRVFGVQGMAGRLAGLYRAASDCLKRKMNA